MPPEAAARTARALAAARISLIACPRRPGFPGPAVPTLPVATARTARAGPSRIPASARPSRAERGRHQPIEREAPHLMSITHLPAQATQSLACLRGEHQHCTGTVIAASAARPTAPGAHHAQDTEARFIRLAVGIGDLGAAA